MSDRNKGILALIISAFGFAMMSAFVKLAGDLPSIQKTLFRNLVSMIFALSLVIYYKESLFGKKENQKYLVVRSIFGTLGIVLNYYAIDKLVLSDANMLNKLSTFFLIIFSAIFLKEKVKLKQFGAVAIAFFGALFIIKPQFSVETIPYLIGVLGAVFAAGAYTILRVLGNKEKYYTVVFYFSFFSTMVLIPFVIISYVPMTLEQFTYLILAGLFATVGQFGITNAYKYAPAREISIFNYTNIIFSAIISLILFGQLPDIISVVGYFIIFGASLYMFLYKKNN